MRVLLQRVKEASVVSDGELTGQINQGILVLVGIEEADGQEDIEWLCRKITQVRIFADEEGVMNKSVLDIGGEVLVVSQFTLHASTKKGNRRADRQDVVRNRDRRRCRHLLYHWWRLRSG